MSALVSAQRAFVQLHGKILGVLASDRLLYNRLRITSLDLTIAINELRALVRHIDRTAASN
ncbi:MAG: hypothetical protein M4D80_06645 [Myxococcota bacterium]|nr:hypothetical protein [Myxococcota bacterium]